MISFDIHEISHAEVIRSLTFLPMRGLSEVTGMMDETVLRKMVRESRMVTPEDKTRV